MSRHHPQPCSRRISSHLSGLSGSFELNLIVKWEQNALSSRGSSPPRLAATATSNTNKQHDVEAPTLLTWAAWGARHGESAVAFQGPMVVPITWLTSSRRRRRPSLDHHARYNARSRTPLHVCRSHDTGSFSYPFQVIALLFLLLLLRKSWAVSKDSLVRARPGLRQTCATSLITLRRVLMYFSPRVSVRSSSLTRRPACTLHQLPLILKKGTPPFPLVPHTLMIDTGGW